MGNERETPAGILDAVDEITRRRADKKEKKDKPKGRDNALDLGRIG